MFGLGTTEILIIAAILVLLFGGKKIPELVRGVSESVREFKEGSKEDKKEKGEEENE